LIFLFFRAPCQKTLREFLIIIYFISGYLGDPIYRYSRLGPLRYR
jgi:hypothetical protein